MPLRLIRFPRFVSSAPLALLVLLSGCGAENERAFRASEESDTSSLDEPAVAATSDLLANSTGARWVGTWATAPAPPGYPEGTDGDFARTGFSNQTIRQLMRVSVGGHKLRVRLSNTFGAQPLTVGHVTVALPRSAPSADIVAKSVRELTFGGRKQITIPRGAQALSDPVAFAVPSTGTLVVSTYFPMSTGPVSWHFTSMQTSYVSGSGDHTNDPGGNAFPTAVDSSFVVSGIDVETSSSTTAVVAIGESITDGYLSTMNENRRWPDRLAERLVDRHKAVLNAGQSGNQMLKDGSDIGFPGLGEGGLARVGRDAFSQIGARTVIVAMGANDIIISSASADEIIAGLRQIAAQGREAGLQMLSGTLTPFGGPESERTQEQEAARVAVNTWLRSNADFDGMIDFDALLRDPADPRRISPAYDAGDQLHPNDAGYLAMANAVPLSLLR